MDYKSIRIPFLDNSKIKEEDENKETMDKKTI